MPKSSRRNFVHLKCVHLKCITSTIFCFTFLILLSFFPPFGTALNHVVLNWQAFFLTVLSSSQYECLLFLVQISPYSGEGDAVLADSEQRESDQHSIFISVVDNIWINMQLFQVFSSLVHFPLVAVPLKTGMKTLDTSLWLFF